MKRFSFLVLLFLLLAATPVFSQEEGELPVAKPVTQGIWVYLGKTIPKGMSYQIERKKSSDKSYTKIGSVTLSASEAEMRSRAAEYHPYFNNLDPIREDEFVKLREYIELNSRTDSMYVSNLPLMHLIAGTAFYDRQADNNTDYIYRITLQDDNENTVSQSESNNSMSLKKSFFPEIHFSEKEYVNGILSLTWKTGEPIEMSFFNIYRSVFGKNEYQKLSGENMDKGVYADEDSVFMLLNDSIGKNPAIYEYLIAPVDAFGNEGERQGYASGGNLDNFYVSPVTDFRAVSGTENNEVMLSWQFETKKYLNGIDIMRSSNYDNGYQRIATLSINDTTFTDILPESGENYYYYLLIHSPEQNALPSAKVFVAYTGASEKPEPPAEIDAVSVAGGITVYWNSSNSVNKGYLVYRRSDSDENFAQISHLIPPADEIYQYNDTSSALQDNEIYEYVVRTIAEDDQQSIDSDTVSASPGKKVILVPPVNLSYNIRDDKISLLWDDMTEWDNNLFGYKVWRRMGNTPWTVLDNDSIQPKKNFYDDIAPAQSGNYEYAVSSWDYFGNESEKSIVTVLVEAAPLPAPPSGIRVTQSGGGIHISWGQMVGDISGFNIYRSEPGNKAELIGTVSKDTDNFTDKKVVAGKLYFYQLSVTNNNGKEGYLSDKTSVRIR